MSFISRKHKKIKRLLNNIFHSREISNRRKLDFRNLEELSKDIPNLLSNEIYLHNDFYGNARVLKNFLGLSHKKSIKAAIEHGICYMDCYWHCDAEAKLPGIIAASDRRAKYLSEKIGKETFAIGPYISYTSGMLSQRQLREEKKRLGKTLLVFPNHSTHHLRPVYEIDKFCKEIKSLESKFDSALICLYWSDILHGNASIYKKYGFECITAGHIYDFNFLPRLKSIISLSDMTMSNEIGTHLGYCIYMRKPHYLYSMKHKRIEGSNQKLLEDGKRRMQLFLKDKNTKIIRNLFGKFQQTISKDQYDIVNKIWGFDQIKTKQELTQIVQHLDREYKVMIKNKI